MNGGGVVHAKTLALDDGRRKEFTAPAEADISRFSVAWMDLVFSPCTARFVRSGVPLIGRNRSKREISERSQGKVGAGKELQIGGALSYP